MHFRLLIVFAFLFGTAQAQWLNFKTPGIPRTRDGKPDLAAPTPRTADGKPDLSGVWMHETTTVTELQRIFGHRFDESLAVDVPGMELGTQHKYAFDILLDFKPENSPMRPESTEVMRRSRALRDATDVCTGVPGIPLAGLLSEPIKIVQAPRLTMILYEAGNSHRQIYTDGRGLPKEYSLPAWLGYSVGHWESDTLVVESGGFNDKAALDAAGHPHSEALHVTERYRRRDYGHMDVALTFDDPKLYTRPFTIQVPHELRADEDIYESFCDNEKDKVHLGKREP